MAKPCFFVELRVVGVLAGAVSRFGVVVFLWLAGLG
jgi:hypothetical protein